jgi:hypothetical protein
MSRQILYDTGINSEDLEILIEEMEMMEAMPKFSGNYDEFFALKPNKKDNTYFEKLYIKDHWIEEIESFILEDKINGLKYSFSKPSFLYSINVLTCLMEGKEHAVLDYIFPKETPKRSFLSSEKIHDEISSRISHNMQNLKQEISIRHGKGLITRGWKKEDKRFNELIENIGFIFENKKDTEIGNATSELWTLKIHSRYTNTMDTLRKLSNSYIFALNCNLRSPLREYNKSTQKITLKKLGMKDIPFPEKIYDKKLLMYYQEGLIESNIVHSYLSFYHCLEHFFVDIREKEMRTDIINELNSMDINLKTKNDIDSLKNTVIKGYNKYKTPGGEMDLLKRLLKNCLDINYFITEINTHDLKFILTQELNFLDKTPKIDLSRKNKISNKLGERIYSIRNALVHRKDDTKIEKVYENFNPKHESQLNKELLIIRILVEQIIESSGKPIKTD